MKSAHSNKKVLIITYYWPPSGGSGVQRWLYFANHLKDLGWEPIVITVKESKASYLVLDNSLDRLAEDIRVYKTTTLEPLRLYSKLMTGDSRRGIPQGEVLKKNFLSCAASFVRGNFFVPDARMGWVAFAVKKAKEIAASESINYLITTGPPHSTHLVGLKLKKNFPSIRWISDFRDPWSNAFYLKDVYRTKYAQKKDEALERRVLECSDAVLTTIGGAFHGLLQAKLKSKQKIFAIPNGYDADLTESVEADNPKEFHVVYTGLLTRNQNYKVVLRALQSILENELRFDIRFTLAGAIAPEIVAEIRSELPMVLVDYKGYLPHHKAVQLMKSGHLLLNFIFNSADTQMISGKLLEYIATGVPILCIGNPHSEAGRFLERGSHARTFSSLEQKEAESFIKSVIEAWKTETPLFNQFDKIDQYSRKALAKQLELILLE